MTPAALIHRGMGAPTLPDTGTCTSCCGFSNWPAAMVQANCAKGAPLCPDNCWYLRAGATCPNTIGDCNNPNNQSSDCDMYKLWGNAVFPPDSIINDICGNQGTAQQYYGPWDPTRTYATGDMVWDTCGQLWSLLSGGRWWKQGVTLIGAGKVGTTGCIGPMGTSDMDPAWMQNITQQSAPWFSTPASGPTPAGSSGPPVAGTPVPLSGSIQAAGGVPAVGAISSPASATSSGLISGIPNWALIGGAALLGVMLFMGRR